MSRTCMVKDCGNSDYRRLRWQQGWCEEHGCCYGHDAYCDCDRQPCKTPKCDCPPPFRLFTFPTERANPEGRMRWIRSVNLQDPKRPPNFLHPKQGHRICSVHFLDGKPTATNPDPTLKMGYLPKRTKLRRRLVRATPASLSSSLSSSLSTAQHPEAEEITNTESPTDNSHTEINIMGEYIHSQCVILGKILLGTLDRIRDELIRNHELSDTYTGASLDTGRRQVIEHLITLYYETSISQTHQQQEEADEDMVVVKGEPISDWLPGGSADNVNTATASMGMSKRGSRRKASATVTNSKRVKVEVDKDYEQDDEISNVLEDEDNEDTSLEEDDSSFSETGDKIIFKVNEIGVQTNFEEDQTHLTVDSTSFKGNTDIFHDNETGFQGDVGNDIGFQVTVNAFEDEVNQDDVDDKTFVKIMQPCYVSIPIVTYIEKVQDEKASADNEPSNTNPDDGKKLRTVYKCPHCEFKSENLQSLKNHMNRRHALVKKHTCGICKKGFRFRSELKKHSALHNIGYGQNCKDCGKLYRSKSALNTHRVKHHGEAARFVCEVEGCGKVYHCGRQYRDHVNTHTNVMIYQCKVCKKKFNTRGSLYQHCQRCGQTEKAVVCTMCDGKFTCKADLKQHMRKHSVEGPGSKCPRCEKSYTYQSSLSRHMKNCKT